MPPGMTVSRLRSYVAAVRAGSRRAMRDPAITMVVLWRIPPRPSRTVPARIVTVGAWARARAGSRASSMGGLRDDLVGDPSNLRRCDFVIESARLTAPWFTLTYGTDASR